MKRNKSARLAAKAAAPAKEETKVIAPAAKAKGKKVEPAAPVAVTKKKGTKVKPAEVDEINATATAAKITAEKELKYVYPADCESKEGADKVELLELRKKFRAGVRRKLASFDKKIKGLMKSNLPEDLTLMGTVESEAAAYRKSVLVNP